MAATETAATLPSVQGVTSKAPAAARPVAAVRPAPAKSIANRTTAAKAVPLATAPATTPSTKGVPTSVWASFFREWPRELPKRGVVISQLNESTVFKSFMLQGDLILLERISPDSMGARFVVLPFDEIATVKYTDQLRQDALEAVGFVGELAS